MKTVLLPALLAAVLFTCGGCAFMDPADRDFYGKGWVRPTELDTAPVHHTIPDPSRPETTTATTTGTAPAATTDPEWLAPVPPTR